MSNKHWSFLTLRVCRAMLLVNLTPSWKELGPSYLVSIVSSDICPKKTTTPKHSRQSQTIGISNDVRTVIGDVHSSEWFTVNGFSRHLPCATKQVSSVSLALRNFSRRGFLTPFSGTSLFQSVRKLLMMVSKDHPVRAQFSFLTSIFFSQWHRQWQVTQWLAGKRRNAQTCGCS